MQIMWRRKYFTVEDEHHVLFHCPAYEYLRTAYICNDDIYLLNEHK